jgi:hypothetical protein
MTELCPNDIITLTDDQIIFCNLRKALYKKSRTTENEQELDSVIFKTRRRLLYAHQDETYQALGISHEYKSWWKVQRCQKN